MTRGKKNLDTSILYRWWSSNPTPPESKFRLLQASTETPRPGYPVAIDAEFIRLQAEEIEMKADGTRQTIRPDRKGLARVSVCRGEGELAGLPFIDDYIAVTEQVVDYLTEWSGICPGESQPRNIPPCACQSQACLQKSCGFSSISAAFSWATRLPTTFVLSTSTFLSHKS